MIKIIVNDEKKAHEALIQSYRLYPAIQQQLRKESPSRKVGDLHTTAELECPEGGINCRNCGDPEFAAKCKEAGHCKNCGTKHGVAPDSVLEANGYRLE